MYAGDWGQKQLLSQLMSGCKPEQVTITSIPKISFPASESVNPTFCVSPCSTPKGAFKLKNEI
jgi:hypothetical protein